MGCDIHTWVEKRIGNEWVPIDPNPSIFMEGRHYGLFGWLHNVRNYSAIPSLNSVCNGWPEDLSSALRRFYEDTREDPSYLFGFCHVSATDLLSVDYSQFVEYCRVTKTLENWVWDGGQTCEPGEGKQTTLAVFLECWALAEILRFCALGGS